MKQRHVICISIVFKAIQKFRTVIHLISGAFSHLTCSATEMAFAHGPSCGTTGSLLSTSLSLGHSLMVMGAGF